MEITQIILFLSTILIVVLIVVYAVHLNHIIKDQGLKIRVLLSNEKATEGFSPAQRYTMAAKYRGEHNGLMPSDKQSTEKPTYVQSQTNDRGDRGFGYLFPIARGAAPEKQPVTTADAPIDIAQAQSNTTDTELVQAGANTLGGLDFDNSREPVDLSELPAQTQQTTTVNGMSNSRINPEFLASSTEGNAPSGNGKDRFRARRRQQ
jgi:hypothetical protein